MKPTWNDVELLIVGSGTMGASLAQTYAQSGFAVGMVDVSDEILQRGFETIEHELEAAKGKIFSPAETRSIRERILGTTSYDQACKGNNLKLVIEAATERLDVKKQVFKCLDSMTAPHVVLASNSSSLDTNILAAATTRPDKVVWMHYFYLPHKNRAAEYAGTDTASGESKALARKFLKLGGKISTRIHNSRKGGVADIIFVALLLEATRMFEEGFDIPTIESAGKKAYGIPVGFLELMDATGLPVGLHSMRSFSDCSSRGDPLYQVYGNFFTPRQNYIELIEQYESAAVKSSVRWVRDNNPQSGATRHGAQGAHALPDPQSVEALSNRFLAIGFVTATETVDAGLITIEDLELLTQNAFLWHEGPFTIMNKVGKNKVREVVERRAELALSFNQDFPLCGLLKQAMGVDKPWTFHLSTVAIEKEQRGAVRRITLSNPRAANAMSNTVFEELKREFSKANNDDTCKVIIFDTAPIKTFIAGAHIPTFIERVKTKDFNAIRRDTEEWQHVIFHIMTGTGKPKIAIVDGQAFGGGVEVACAFALDPNSIVLITNRTSFSLPETRLGIYPGLRGTLTLPQIIFKKTRDAETALGLSRYFTLAGGIITASPQVVYQLGCADAIVPQHRRDDAAAVIAEAIIGNDGRMISKDECQKMSFERLPTNLSFDEARELQVAKEMFTQPDLLPTLVAQGRNQLPIFYTGETKSFAERAARRVAANSPNAVYVADKLISNGFEKMTNGVDNETLARFELEHHLCQVFEHPDALIGLEAAVQGRFPNFKRRYPL